MAFVGYSFPHSRHTSAFILAMVTPPSSRQELRPYGTACKRIAVVEQFGNRRVRPAERTVGIAFHFDFPELRLARVKIEQSIGQGPADPQYELERLRRLNRPDNTRKHPDDSSLLAGGH